MYQARFECDQCTIRDHVRARWHYDTFIEADYLYQDHSPTGRAVRLL